MKGRRDQRWNSRYFNGLRRHLLRVAWQHLMLGALAMISYSSQPTEN
jgi:hypothetical protein